MKPFLSSAPGLSSLDPATASMIITAASDVALLVSSGREPLIREVAFGNDEIARELDSGLRGRSWLETVTIESRPKVQALLNDAAAQAPRWRQINHSVAQGPDLPVMYTAVQVGTDGGIVAVGRSMRALANMQQQLVEAQQSMDREYLRLRQAETRHRLLFQLSSEAVLIVDANTQKVTDANPAAQRLLNDVSKRLVGKSFIDGFDSVSRPGLETLLSAVLATGRTQEVAARVAGDKQRDCFVSVSLFREGKTSFFLVRIQAKGGAIVMPNGQSKVMEVVEASPDAFVVTDLGGYIQFANRAFLDCVQVPTSEQVREQPIERWLGRSGVDYSVISAQLREHGSVRRFATVMRGELGTELPVEVSAVAVPEGEEPCHGFSIREVAARQTVAADTAVSQPRNVQNLTELVGRVPLKELVRESTDMIEKLCIEAALQLTGDNRASAADILGLSRQSLYAKLRRYGLGDLGPDDASDEATER